MPVNECLVPGREDTKYLTPQISGVQTLFAKLTGLVLQVDLTILMPGLMKISEFCWKGSSKPSKSMKTSFKPKQGTLMVVSNCGSHSFIINLLK